ncbi:MAG: hypothetical protein AAB393_02180 [Bacteroidota bacterium]
MNTSMNHIVGIDIAKDTFTARLLALGESPTAVGKVESFPNSSEGYAQLKRWAVGTGVGPESS